MSLSANARDYCEALWGQRLREIIRKRDSELEQRRQGLADPSDIYKRIGFWNYFQPNLDHVAEVGRVRAECLRKAYSQDGQKLSQAVIDEILSDVSLHIESSATSLLTHARNEHQLSTDRPGTINPSGPDLLGQVSNKLVVLQRDTTEELSRTLKIMMYEEQGKPVGSDERQVPIVMDAGSKASVSSEELVPKIFALIGLSASFRSYRADQPSDSDEKRYQELWLEVDADLAKLRAQGLIDAPNPNPHRTLSAMWAWIWAEGGGGKTRKERPSVLYADLVSRLKQMPQGARSNAIEAGTLSQRAGLFVIVDKMLLQNELVGLIFCDLDNFKAVNDRHGHSEGDRCLEVVANVLQSVSRSRGEAFRYGGDEFVILLPNVNHQEATATADRIRTEIETAAAEFGVTASIGVVCSSDRDLQDSKSLLAAADEAAYVSKFSGKNRVSTWPLDPLIREEVRQKRSEAEGR
ncbi:MAG: GGDEF domain-containing protein [Acidobacteriia bacterium]|nr:GGDEF domain-containing protein [Terriglobia bacterium]